MRAGVISNRSSRRNRRDGVAVTEALARHPEVLHVVLDGVGDVERVVADFARAGVDPIVIDGGDGTVQRVITAVMAEPGYATTPHFAVVPSGTTNMTARDVGLRGPRARALEALLAGIEAGRAPAIARRTSLHLAAPGCPPLLGFFLGAGAITWATGPTRSRIESRGFAGGLSVALAIGGTIWRCLFARPTEPPLAGVAMRIAADARDLRAGPCFLMLATTLHGLVLGLDPFWGDGDGPIKLLAIEAPPRRLPAALPSLLRGRPAPWMEAAGYRSLRANALEIAVSGPVLLDGEHVPVASGTAFTVRAGPEIAFVRAP
jgi:hypothetical protein